ncbi:HesA/MoeB/ThiF family protein [Swaminathania salitolerans]|uniref:Molybdopterin-synthase adenylyltransferase n=1 Tax=Swaminathania salitolerans TaxID=182838 RepID=A0A511BSI0_9PROT|nr:HesA/MoeB/ThiF family protein [Swaminathania salitolerans]GBQ13338.1 molybdopterin biosynthesis protein MoeB [Swaminathania salitolerans LMG 21291]GEL03287.1 molybdopterin biosynthesis protein [Swaminathania salitolerans]
MTVSSFDLTFPDEALQRYSRHILLPEVGATGQARLRAASVLIVGAGGLGSPLALYLAAAGVGRIGLADDDRVELSNLQRQILFDSGDIGQGKARRGQARLSALNPDIRVEIHETRVDARTLPAIMAGYDLVCDGSDNFTTRYAVADCCQSLGKTLISGAVQRFEGTVSTFSPQTGGPCYRCLHPDADEAEAPGCGQAGIFGAVTGVIGTLMATEALKELLAIGRGMSGRVLVWNALDGVFRTLSLSPDPACAGCGAGR